MKIPNLKVIPEKKRTISTFSGINRTSAAAEGEFSETENCVSDFYPRLSSRKIRRGIYARCTQPQGIICKDAVCHIDGGKLYINRAEVAGLVLSTAEGYTPKKLVSFGSRILIFPDAKWVDTLPRNGAFDYGNIENTFTQTAAATYRLCRSDGSEYSGITVSQTVPDTPSDGNLWLDTGREIPVLKQYSTEKQVFSEVKDVCVKIACTDIGLGFSEGDNVLVSGAAPTSVFGINGVKRIVYLEEDCIAVSGIMSTASAVTQNTGLSVKRELPLADCYTESGNRLWCARYGPDRDGNTVNMIYASREGDFKNFLSADGAAEDGYSVSCGSDGRFTAAVSHLGYPIFFKESCLHKVYGSGALSFQVQTTYCEGVKRNCGESALTVGGKLYYMSRGGICRYDGSLPVRVSDKLGIISCDSACAGSIGGKYYINVKKDSDGELYVYDTLRGLWHREDKSIVIDGFASSDGELYFIDGSDGIIKTEFGSGGIPADENAAEDSVEWRAESRLIGAQVPEGKYLSGITVNLTAEVGARVSLYIRYGSGEAGKWECVSTVNGAGELKTVSLSVRPVKSSCFRIALGGEGGCDVTSVTVSLSEAGK